jgi:hypothetical protein
MHAGSAVAYRWSRTSRLAHATLCGCSWLRIVLPKYSPCPQRGCANAGWWLALILSQQKILLLVRLAG